jgi:hypothetical protein
VVHLRQRDSAYNKDFITGMGITNAFHDAELCSTAVERRLPRVRIDEGNSTGLAIRADPGRASS